MLADLRLDRAVQRGPSPQRLGAMDEIAAPRGSVFPGPFTRQSVRDLLNSKVLNSNDASRKSTDPGSSKNNENPKYALGGHDVEESWSRAERADEDDRGCDLDSDGALLTCRQLARHKGSSEVPCLPSPRRRPGRDRIRARQDQCDDWLLQQIGPEPQQDAARRCR
jgi:hypothetical protein